MQSDRILRVLFIADIIGKPGRRIVSLVLPIMKKEDKIDFVIANGENAASNGLTENVVAKLYRYGVDCITTGNHLWDRKEIIPYLDTDRRLLRPLNYPQNVPGYGYNIFEKEGVKIGVINLSGRVFIKELDCPFRTVGRILEEIQKETRIIVVDVHAEATSEKQAIGWFLDGKVSAVIGTHTHVQTADERILPGGTAYITDAGMTGPFDSVIGVKKEIAIERFLMQIPIRLDTAVNDVRLNGVIVDIDTDTGKTLSISRLEKTAPESLRQDEQDEQD